ncbi:MAG: hypothetical protein LE168_00330 [Endomicrobium sp.]|nr:hypothetical protein [Endomicrobium sp.]
MDGYLIQILSVDVAANGTLSNTYKKFDKVINNSSNNDIDIGDMEKAKFFVSLPNLLFISKPIAVGQNYLSLGLGIFPYVDFCYGWKRAAITAVDALPVTFRISSLKSIHLPGELSFGANFKYITRFKYRTGYIRTCLIVTTVL